MVWQKTFTLPSASRGCHLVTNVVEKEINEGLKGVKAGILTLFIQHTSAALTINENYDPTVRKDMDMAMDKLVPESFPWKHVDEGPDDSASHTKASLFGPTITVPITDGRMNLGSE
jgi:secondary thiamine-phosphate synthase enzyme